MVSLLKMKQNVKFLAICTDCLHLLGYGCSQAKVQMVQAEASVQLVHIMNTYTYEKVTFIPSHHSTKVVTKAENNFSSCGQHHVFSKYFHAQKIASLELFMLVDFKLLGII